MHFAFGTAAERLEKTTDVVSLSKSHHNIMDEQLEMLRRFPESTYSTLKQAQQQIQGAASAV